MLTRTIISVLAVIGVAHVVAGAQGSMSADEQDIREIIEKMDDGQKVEETSDAVRFSAAYQVPFVRGQGEAQLRSQARGHVVGSERSRSNIRHVEVASSGDMAYAFIDSILTFQNKTE